jgi:ribosomal protein S18 acetylase RimI-like enzyme
MSTAQLLARAFQQDPYFRWVEPRDEFRLKFTRVVFAAMIARAKAVGGVVEEPGIGAVEWKPASHSSMGLSAIVTSGMWRVGLISWPSAWWRLAAHDEAAMQLVRPALAPDSAYLSTLGVEPALAGQGHGGRLLTKTLEVLSSRFKRCVLRTEQPKNVAFYARHGFELVHESVVKVSGLKV